MVGYVRATLQALLPLLTENPDESHLTRAQQHYAKARQQLDDLAKTRQTPG